MDAVGVATRTRRRPSPASTSAPATPATAETPASYVDYKAAIHITADQRVAYNRFPPVGGPHDGTWANCNGIVYATAVRNENMVHTLEHGAVWITYNPDTITPDDLATLTALVDGPAVHHAVAVPGAGLDRSPCRPGRTSSRSTRPPTSGSKQFITALRQNRWVYPETGATCQQPSFDVDEPAGVRPDAARRRRDSDVRHRRHHRDQSRWPSPSSDQSVDATATAPVSNAEAPTTAAAPAETAVTSGP